jgi:hypothetical protein
MKAGQFSGQTSTADFFAAEKKAAKGSFCDGPRR